MSLKKTLILALILCGLIYSIMRFEIPAQEAAAKKDFLFKGVERTAFENMLIKNSGETISLVNTEPGKENSKWEFSDLKGSYAEPGIISSIITSLLDIKLDQVLPKEDVEGDLSVYGLKDDALSVSVKGGGDKELLIGKKNDYIGMRYLKVEGDDNIYLISEGLYLSAAKKREDYRDKTPLEFNDMQVKTIELQRASQKIRLEHGPGDKWLVTQPVSASGSTAAISDYLRNIRNLSASNIIDQPFDSAKYKLEKPDLSIKLENSEAGKPATEIIVNKIPDGKDSKFYFYIKGGPSVFETANDPFVNLSKSGDDFREKKLFQFAVGLVNSFEVETAEGAKFSGVKENHVWKVGGKEGDKVFIDQWLSNLSDTSAQSFPANNSSSQADYGFGKLKYKVSIELGEGKRSLVIGSELKGGGYYSAADDLNNPFIISGETYKKIAIREEALITTQPQATATAVTR